MLAVFPVSCDIIKLFCSYIKNRSEKCDSLSLASVHVFTLQSIFENSLSMPNVSTSSKHATWFLEKSFGNVEGVTYFAACCWLWSHTSILVQRFVCVGGVKSQPFKMGIGLRQAFVVLQLYIIINKHDNISGNALYASNIWFCSSAKLMRATT